MSNVLKTWLSQATISQKIQLASQVRTSVPMLYQLAGAYRTDGKINVNPDLARRLEKASLLKRFEGLPELRRELLSPPCAECEFAKQCRKGP